MYKTFKEQKRDDLDSSFNSPFVRPNTHDSKPAVPLSSPSKNTQSIMDGTLGLRDIRHPELQGWAVKLSHKKLMTDHKKWCLFHDHCLLWGLNSKDADIGGCFNFLELKSNINCSMIDHETLRFHLSDRERLFKFGNTTKDWHSRILKSIMIRDTQGNCFEKGKLLFSSAAKIYGLQGNNWMDRGVVSIRLIQHVKDQFADTAIFCDNKSDNAHSHYLVRNKIVAKGKNAWIMHCCYNMKNQFRVEVVALRFFSKADSEHFKEAFDTSFPRPGHQLVPELPDSKLHNHSAFDEPDQPIDADVQFDFPLNADPNNVYVPDNVIKQLPHSLSDKRFSDISDSSIITAKVNARKLEQISSDADLARQLQAMEIQSAGGGADKKPYESDDEDSLFYQPAFKQPQPSEIPVVDSAPELPKYQAEGVQEVSPSKFAAEGSRRWLITDVKEEVKHILTDLSAVSEIIETHFIDPLEDITVNVLPRTLTEDLTSAQLDSMVYDRLRSLTVSAGGPADMVPEYVKPPSKIISFGPGKLGITFNKKGKVSSVGLASQAHVLGVKEGWIISEVNGKTFSVSKFRQVDTTKPNNITFVTGPAGSAPAAADVPPASSAQIARPAASSSFVDSAAMSYGGVKPVQLYEEEEVQAAVPPAAPKVVTPPPQPPKAASQDSFAVKPLTSWDVLDVQNWLSSLKLDRYQSAFENFGVDGETLDSITDGFLTMNLNVNPIHVKKMKRSLDTIRAAS